MTNDLHPDWSEPPHSLRQRLCHTLDLYQDESDDQPVLRATMNAYAPYGEAHSWTGLTLGDLRAMASILLGSHTLADLDLKCQFNFTGDKGPRSCSRCGTLQDKYEGGDCPEWNKALTS